MNGLHKIPFMIKNTKNHSRNSTGATSLVNAKNENIMTIKLHIRLIIPITIRVNLQYFKVVLNAIGL